MGWFWADQRRPVSTPPPTIAESPAAITQSDAPSSCPMHNNSLSITYSSLSSSSSSSPSSSSCSFAASGSRPTNSNHPLVDIIGNNETDDKMINPLNLMYANISQSPLPDQETALPTARETSSIPRGDGTKWEYPSPQQMYNAMRRKGYNDAPGEEVESMVSIHNWINEGAWAEICEWERKFGSGVLGYFGLRERQQNQEGLEPRLCRFEGRREDLSPKAAMYLALSRMMPEKFGGEPPFDRHDWYVLRQSSKHGEPQEVRYVIDYYSGSEVPTGEPVFYLDVRPAIDRPGLMVERIVSWAGNVWERASGSDVRREEQEKKKASN